MRMVVIGDMHGRFDLLQKIMDEIATLDYDLLVSPGDFTDMFDITPDFTQMEIADVTIQKLLAAKKPLFCVPGNHDPYEILDLFDEYGVNLHNKKRKMGGITFVGWGGAETPFNTSFEPTDEETEEALGKILHGVKGKWVLITHAPPKGIKLDKVDGSKHVGAQSVAAIIKKAEPILAVTAHIHENRGTVKMGKTTVFYPGPAYKGFYGVVEVGPQGVSCVIHQAR